MTAAEAENRHPQTRAGDAAPDGRAVEFCSKSAPAQTRAWAATGGAALVVLAVRVPSIAQRTPRVAVDLALGPVALVVTVARKRLRGRLDIRLPETSDGAPGVMLPPELQAEAEAAALAAVRANPEAWHHLLGRGL